MDASRDPQAILDALARVTRALLDDDRRSADRAIEAIRFTPTTSGRRRKVSERTKALVFSRGHFTCCYCGRRTIPSVVLQCFTAIWPDQFPNHPHGPMDRTHSAYWTILSSLEHLEAGTLGGDWTDEENLACACWPCNQAKGNSAQSGRFTHRAPPDTSWDGMTGIYPKLWIIAGRPRPEHHGVWLRAWHGEVP